MGFEVISSLRQWLGLEPESPRRLADRLIVANARALPGLLRKLAALPAGEVDRAIVAACAFMGDGAARELADEYKTLVAVARAHGVEAALAKRDEEHDRAARALHLFTGAETPLEMRWLIQEHPSLLTFKTARMLEVLSEQWPDAAFRENAKIYLQVLEDCRRKGVASALSFGKSKVPEIDLVPPSELLQRFLGTEWDDGMAELLAEHPGFLDPRFDLYLRFSALMSGSEAHIAHLGIASARLARCRDIGVDAAVAERWIPGMMPVEPPPNSVLLWHAEGKSGAEVLEYLANNPEAADFREQWHAQLEWLDWMTTPPSWPLPAEHRLSAIALHLVEGKSQIAAGAFAMALLDEIGPGTSHFSRAYLHYVCGRELSRDCEDFADEALREALKHLQKALKVYTTDFPLRHARVQASIANVQLEFFRRGNEGAAKKALAALRAALDLTSADDSPMNHGGYLYDYARALVLTKAPVEEALEALRRAERFLARNSSPFGLHERVLGDIARLLASEERWSEAGEVLREQLAILEKGYEKNLFTRGRDKQIRALNPAYRLAAYCAARQGDAVAAMDLLERGRARRFRDALPLRLTRPEGVPDDAWEDYQETAASLQSLGDLQDVDLEGMIDDPESWDARQQERRAASIAALKENPEIAPFLQRLFAPPSPADVDEVLAAHGAALVCFAVEVHGSVAILTRAGEPARSISLPELRLEDVIEVALEFLDAQSVPARVGKAIDASATKLGASLFDPIVAALDGDVRRLIVVPGGLLGFLPLDLALIRGGSVRLRDTYTVTYAPSVALLVESHRRARAVRPRRLVAVVNPQGDANLAFAPVEQERVSAYFEVRRMLGAGATIEDIAVAVRYGSYLHWIGHGVYDFDEPDESGLLLSGDERLSVEELWSRRIDVSQFRMVVLSACQTGMTDVKSADPDEAMGLPAALMLAGVPCVLASLWPVPDTATAMLMEAFYAAHIGQDMPPGDALRTAQEKLRATTGRDIAVYAQSARSPEQAAAIRQALERERLDALAHDARPFAHPWFWAGFQLHGV